MINLVSNAVKFTPEGGRVTIRGFLSGQRRLPGHRHGYRHCQGRPAASGTAIRTDREPARQELPGSGLGLALSKSLIDLHGGSLAIDSKLGEGTTVSFVLPITQAQLIDPEAALAGDLEDDSFLGEDMEFIDGEPPRAAGRRRLD